MNSNVLSILDNFSYGDPLKPTYLKSAIADYCVIGWHSNGANDPFTGDPRPLTDRLGDMYMTVANPDDARLILPNDTKSLYHGSMYTVNFNTKVPPATVLADTIGKNFYSGEKMEPVAVGATALDALIAFLAAHDKDGSMGDLSSLSEDIVKIASLLMATDESYDSQVQAQDLLYGYNYDSSDGGMEWHFDGTIPPNAAPNTPAVPSLAEAQALLALNEAQTRLDIVSNNLRGQRWEMFACWWKLVSDRDNSVINGNNKPKDIQKKYRDTADVLYRSITDLANSQKNLQDEIIHYSKAGRYKRVSKLPFFQRKDPSISIAGMSSGWPDNWLSSLLVRFEDEVVAGAPPVKPPPVSFLPSLLQTSASKIVSEFLCGPNNNPNTKYTIPWWKSWNDTQPWFPLFVEWEALYFHIPKDLWKVETVNVGNPPHPMVRYCVDEPLDSGKYLSDMRTISGRVMILPQAALSLQSLVSSLVATFPDDDSGPITKAERATLLDPALWAKFKYLSLSLSGFTDHLITRMQGAHVKPNARKVDNSLQALQDAINASCYGFASGDPPIFPASYLTAIQAESGVTPYGNAIDFEDNSLFPFKAVTSGQAMFTKLNIIDKFGQAIPALEPKPIPKDQTMPVPSLYPCISDYLMPNSIGGHPNVVFRDKDQTLSSRFVQVCAPLW